MKPTTFCLALLALTGHAMADISISQSDANANTKYKAGANNTYIFTEDVTFQGYEETRPQGYSDALIFWGDRGSSTPNSTFQGDASASYNLVFDSNRLTYEGEARDTGPTTGGVLYATYATFKDFNTVEFSNNLHQNNLTFGAETTQTVAHGGSFGVYRLTLDNVGHFVVSGNTASGTDIVIGGGGHFNEFKTGASGTGDITVSNNRIELQSLGGYAQGGGFGNNNGGSSDEFYNIGRMTFEGNVVTYSDTIARDTGYATSMHGGAIKSTNAKFKNTLNLRFTGNIVDGSTQNHDVRALGGGISSASAQFMSITSADAGPAILFSENRVLRNTAQINSWARGGAIECALLLIEGSGDTLFENNSATDNGGAIHLSMLSGNAYTSYLYADNGDITFKGNTDSLGVSNERNSGIANAIHAGVTGTKTMGIDMNADTGRSIYFYDRITSSSLAKENLVLNINNDTEGDYDGKVVFSGKHAAATLAGSEASGDFNDRVAASKKSDVNAQINLHKGTLRIEEGATLGRRYDAANDAAGTGAQFTMTGGVLDISGSALNGTGILAAALIEIKGGTIMAGEYAAFEANVIDMSEGAAFDLAYYFAGGAMQDLGLALDAETLTLGGMLTIADTGAGYYNSAFWGSDRSFTLFDSTDVDSVTGSFTGIQSAVAGSDTIDSSHAYEGVWSTGWEGNRFVAYWTTLTPIPEPASSGLALLGLAAFAYSRRRP